MNVLEGKGYALDYVIYDVCVPADVGHAIHGDHGILRGLGVFEGFSARRLVDQPGEVYCIRVVSIVVSYR